MTDSALLTHFVVEIFAQSNRCPLVSTRVLCSGLHASAFTLKYFCIHLHESPTLGMIWGCDSVLSQWLFDAVQCQMWKYSFCEMQRSFRSTSIFKPADGGLAETIIIILIKLIDGAASGDNETSLVIRRSRTRLLLPMMHYFCLPLCVYTPVIVGLNVTI